MAVIADFGSMYTIDDYQTKIADQLAHIDVAVLALNAGFAHIGPFIDITNKEVEMQCQVNTNHVLYTAKVMAGQLSKRFDEKKVKSAMVMTSSVTAMAPISGMLTYSTTKIFTSYIARALNVELDGKVDVITFEPAGVATKMIGNTTNKTSMFTISAERAADTCFRDLGHQPMTHGAFRHYHISFYFDIIPTRWI